MTNYTKTVNFTAKDILPTGNPSKLVKGAEIDAEFNAIQTAVATKAELAGSSAQAFSASTFTGTFPQLAASSGSSLVGYIPAGTGAVATTAQAKLRESVSVKDFGAVGDGITDDLQALNNASTAAIVAGVPLLLLSNTYAISNTWSIPNGLTVIGAGCGQYPLAGFESSADFIATPKTRIKALAGFPALTPVIQVKTPDNSKYTYQAVHLSGIFIDCDNIADYGLDVISVKNSKFSDILVFQPKTRGVLEDCLVATVSGTAQAGGVSSVTLATSSSTRDSLYNGLSISITGGTGAGQSGIIASYVGSTQVATMTTSWVTIPDATSTYTITGVGTTEGNNASQFNKYEQVGVWVNATSSATGWLQTGTTINNINQCEYSAIKIKHHNGDGLIIENADTNTWTSIDTITVGGTGVGVRLKGNNKNLTEFARNNTFVRTQLSAISGGTGGIVVESGTTKGAQDNCILSYSTGNSSPQPVIQEGNSRFWFNIDGGSTVTDWRSFTPTITFATPGDLSVSYTVQIGRFKKHGRTAEVELRLSFTPTYTTASGDFIINLPTVLQAAAPSGAGTHYGMTISESSTGWTWGTATFVTANVIHGTTQIKIYGHQSNTTSVVLGTTNFVSGTAKSIRITGVMECLN